MNNVLNEQLHDEKTHDFAHKKRVDDNEQNQRKHIAKIFDIFHFLFILQRKHS